MNRDHIRTLLEAARKEIRHAEFVIIGSLSVLGTVEKPDPGMVQSIDVDLYPKDDPGRAGQVERKLGPGSAFEAEHGFYADAVSPALATLPEGWEARLKPIRFDSGVVAWFLDVHDAAISKYARGEARDREWIRAGLKSAVLSIPTLEYRLRETHSMTSGEAARTREFLEADRAWLARAGSRRKAGR